MKSPLNWYGGKYYMKNDIIELFPKHKTYVEGFGGAGHILFAKEKSTVDVYNDINDGLYTFFKVLRDKERYEEFIRRVQLTIYSRKDFEECKNTWYKEKDEIEKARKFYVAVMQSRNSQVNGNWRYSTKIVRRGMSQCVSSWLSKVDESLVDIVERLREVQIENLDILKLIDIYDSEETLFYLDPPYLHSTREAKNIYEHEMTEQQHIELIDKLLNIKGKVILSGYDNEIYERLIENGWRKQNLGNYAKRTSGCKTIGVEMVWLNYDIEK